MYCYPVYITFRRSVANCGCLLQSIPTCPTSTPPPLVVPHPLSFPRGGWGTVTWSTQNFSLRLIVLLCG